MLAHRTLGKAVARRLHRVQPMALMMVTCPESAHLETIDHEEHPLRMLIVKCTAYPGEHAPRCPRTCAARLDQRRHHKKRLADGTILFATSCLRRTTAS